MNEYEFADDAHVRHGRGQEEKDHDVRHGVTGDRPAITLTSNPLGTPEVASNVLPHAGEGPAHDTQESGATVPQEEQRHCWCDRYKAAGGGMCEPCAARKAQEEIAECHGIISALWAITDPDGTDKALMARVHRVLGADHPEGECGNAICKQLTEAQEEIARLTQERDALRPADVSADECSFAVLSVRMARQGYSYDAKAGIWWKDDDKPGVLEAAEARAAAAEARIHELEQEQALYDKMRQGYMEAANRRVEAAEIALRPYVQHKDNCQVWMTLDDGHRMVVPKEAGLEHFHCTCGLSTVLAQLPQQD